MTSNKISNEDMIYCLEKCYDFSHREAVQLTGDLSDFGFVKIETVKKYLRPAGKGKDRYERESPDKEKNAKSKSKGAGYNKKGDKDDRMVNPVTGIGQNRLINPQKRKLNIPLIK